MPAIVEIDEYESTDIEISESESIKNYSLEIALVDRVHHDEDPIDDNLSYDDI